MRVVDVQNTLDHNPLASVQRILLALCFSVMFLDGYDTAIMAFVAPALSQAWHVAPSEMRVAVSAALFGVAFGALLAGPLADRLGRRVVLIGSVLFFGCWSLGSAWATGLTSLAWLRFFTGLGLGAAMPNAATLTAEYAPARHRATMVAFLFCGFTLGSASGGLLGGFLIPNLGWHSAFVVGGIVPIALAALMPVWLPESIHYLAERGGETGVRLVRALLATIERRAPISPVATVVYPDRAATARRGPIVALFARDLAFGTFALWTTFFLGLLVIFLLRSWLPTLVTLSGQSIERAVLLSALFDIGGTIGALSISRLVDRLRSDQVVSASYLTAATAIALFARFSGNVAVLAIGIFVLGFLLSGPQACLPARAAKFYPTAARATGVAWVLGMGRFGGIAGALSGGALLGLGWSLSAILSALSAPAMLAAAIMWVHVRHASGAWPTGSRSSR